MPECLVVVPRVATERHGCLWTRQLPHRCASMRSVPLAPASSRWATWSPTRPGVGASPYITGHPHVVLVVLPSGTGPEVCMNARGPSRGNIRMAYMDADHDIAETWVEHWRLEPWVEKKAAD